MTKYQLDPAQAARKAAMLVEIEITCDSIADGELDLHDVAALQARWPDGSMHHAAYTAVLAIFASN